MINDKSSGEVFNISGDTPRKMRYYADKLKELSGLEGIEEVIEPKFWREIDIDYQMGNDEKFRKLTGYQNKYDKRGNQFTHDLLTGKKWKKR